MVQSPEDKVAALFQPLALPCGVVLKNRIAKSAMSDSLGDGRGNPTELQMRLYERWARGGLAVSIVGEVQGDPRFAEKPGNLVLGPRSDLERFRALAHSGMADGASLWLQLGHAGAMAHPPISDPKGPTALNLPGLTCAAFTKEEIADLPSQFARTAMAAKELGFGGVQIHAAHGFLLSQFLSPLFNQRKDDFGGAIENRMRLIFEIIEKVRYAVGPNYPVAIKLNATDQLEGGFSEFESLRTITALDQTDIDLIEISGGTYFPGAKAASDSVRGGPYFLQFAKRARPLTDKPLMVTGGFKDIHQAIEAIDRGIDLVGLARALVLDPELPNSWRSGRITGPDFPKFSNPPEGGGTAWFTMLMTAIARGIDEGGPLDPGNAKAVYDARDNARATIWNAQSWD